MANAWINLCRFNPTAGGTTDWTYSSAITGYQSPTLAGAVNGSTYEVHAWSADQSQWEISTGTYNSGTGVFSRTTVLYNSSGTGTATGQSGAGTKISFSTVPQVAAVMLAKDIYPPGQILGTATNDNASAGNVGEFIISTVLVGAAVALTSGVVANVTSAAPTAGDWDSEGCVWSSLGSGNVTFWEVGTSTTSATLATRPNTQSNGTISSASNLGLTTTAQRFSLASTTTVFLVVSPLFSATCSAYGFVSLRRAR